MFAADHDGVMPASTASITPYLGETFDLSQIDLVAVGKLSDIRNAGTVVLLKSKSVSSTGKRAVAFVDGHCELVPEK